MADIFILPGPQILDVNGDAVAGAKAYFYDPETTNHRTVYKEGDEVTPHTQPVVADSAGRFAPIYIPTGNYRVVVKSSDDATTYIDADNVNGALDLSAFEAQSFARPLTPTDTKVVDDNIVAADIGKFIEVNPTAADVTLSLLSAATVDDGKGVEFKHTGSANDIILDAAGAETVGGSGNYTFSNQGKSFSIISNVANWVVSSNSVVDDEITLGFLADITAGSQIEGDANDDPVLLAPSDLGKVATSQGAGAAKIMQYPMANFTEYDKGELAHSTRYTQAHGLGENPSHFEVWIVCRTTDLGYAVGDEIEATSLTSLIDGNRSHNKMKNATNVEYITNSSNNSISASHLTTGVATSLVQANWDVIFRVWP